MSGNANTAAGGGQQQNVPVTVGLPGGKTLVEMFTHFKRSVETSLNGCMENIEKLPEPIRAQLKDLATNINASLSKMQPLEMVPAAQDANYALNSLGYAMSQCAEWTASLMASMNGLKSQFVAQGVSLNELKTSVDEGKLVSLDEVNKRVEKALNERSALLAGRRAELVKCGLPVPMDDGALLGDDAAFKSQVERATNRAKELKGLSLNGAADPELLFAGDEVYGKVVKLAGVQGRAGAAAGGATTPEPLAGGGGSGSGSAPAAGAAGGGATKKVRCI